MTERHDPAELERRLYAELRKTRAAMIGLAEGESRHLQPMKPYVVDEEKPVWFLCRRNVHLVAAVAGQAHPAMLALIGDDHHLYASLAGALHEERDQGRIDLFWSSVADAWLPEGRTSPEVTLLRFDPTDAEVWISDNAFKLAWEVAKANYARTAIDSGDKAHLTLE